MSGTGSILGLSDVDAGTLTNSATVGAVDVAAGATLNSSGTTGAVTNAGTVGVTAGAAR
ncbi:MAG: hypothetical protein ACE368_07585 [Paracoccaceae bacterium]